MAGGAGAGRQANRARGAYGERRAAQWYLNAGYTVVDRNWRSGKLGELDLVVSIGRTLVFCEVKARASDAYGSAAEAITPVKQLRLRRLAGAWLAAHDLAARDIRFDLVTVTGTTLEVFEAAF